MSTTQEEKDNPLVQRTLGSLFQKVKSSGAKWLPTALSTIPKDPEAMMQFWAQVWTRPALLTQFWMEFASAYQHEQLQWWEQVLKLNDKDDEHAHKKQDRRFRHKAWKKSPTFDFIKRSYLVTAELYIKIAETTPLQGEAKEKVQFYTQSFVDAMSPSNFILTNPEVIQEAVNTKGKSLLRGFQNLLSDVKQRRITLTNEEAFHVGDNLATTPGAVVFQNRLFQLIQYNPTTEQVHERPLLIIPPCINKYYVLDLKESNSYVKWATEQGHTVFIMSWVNATKDLKDAGWDEFVTEGVCKAIEVTKEICSQETINAVSWCVGGTLTATALAWMAKRGEKPLESITFLTTLLDFSDPGQVDVFLTPEEVSKRAKKVAKDGVFSGKQMAMGFNMLRANDLIWSYVVNNYLLGKTPPPFDLLYWNSDPTNLPAKMYNSYIQTLYLKNKLIKGAFKVKGEVIKLADIETPCYFFSAINDHIAPWKTTYTGALELSGPKTFVLGQSGHIAGVVNHPSKNKRGYWTQEKLAKTPDIWFEQTTAHEGSWWPHWNDWVRSFTGESIPARNVLGTEKYPPLEDAPGTYVRVNCDGVVETSEAAKER